MDSRVAALVADFTTSLDEFETVVGSAVLQGDELVIDGKEHGRRSHR